MFRRRSSHRCGGLEQNLHQGAIFPQRDLITWTQLRLGLDRISRQESAVSTVEIRQVDPIGTDFELSVTTAHHPIPLGIKGNFAGWIPSQRKPSGRRRELPTLPLKRAAIHKHQRGMEERRAPLPLIAIAVIHASPHATVGPRARVPGASNPLS